MNVLRSFAFVSMLLFSGIFIGEWKSRNLYGFESLDNHEVEVLQEVHISGGSVEQGILYTKPSGLKEVFYSSNQAYMSKFDEKWNLIRSVAPEIDGISEPHIGILSWANNFIWAGVIDLKEYRHRKSNTRIIKVDPETLNIVTTFDFSSISKYIDAFDVEGTEFWVGYRDFVSVYILSDQNFRKVRSYRVYTGTPQGLRVTEQYLCVIGESVTMHVRHLKNGIYCYDRRSLREFEDGMTANLRAFIDAMISSLNRRLNSDFFNFYITDNINMPQKVWAFGFPSDHIDNEGFSFSSESEGIIWVSDVEGNVARKIKLESFGESSSNAVELW